MSEPDVSGLVTVAQAMRILDATPVATRVRHVPLAEAAGLRLAAPLIADRDYPPFHRSQMDGFAVRQADVGAAPVDLRVLGEIAAGQTADRAVGPGEAFAIMTGAPVPEGADAVVPVESTQRIDEGTVRIADGRDAARFISPRGSDCPRGRTVVAAGEILGPTQLAVAACVGAAELDVFAPPTAGVLSTGDELVPVDAEPGPARIRNSNTPMLIAHLRALRCEASDLGQVSDDPEAIRAALRRGLERQALFVTGGMSMGEHDHVPRLLKELGVDLKIGKLRIKPGKPFVYGTFRGNAAADEAPACHVFGLPGNPVSAYVCTVRLASRILTRLAGGTPRERWLTGRLDTGLPANGPREFHQPAIRAFPPGRDSTHGEFAAVTPLKWTGSADLFTLARANVLIVRPENDPPLPRGTVIRVLEI